jgi:SAM-dependent methyltransferase
MTASARDSACWQLAADKPRFGLSLQEVRKVDSYLRERWGIVPPLPPDEWPERLRRLGGKRLFRQYCELHDEMAMQIEADLSPPESLVSAFYDVIADHRISSHVHSQKRTEILDAGCLLVHLIRSLGVDGPVLDVGCHIGYHSLLLAKECGVSVHGIDRCRKAIERAQCEARHEPLVTFSCESLAEERFREKFELVYAVRSIPCDSGFVAAVAKVMRPGGVVVFVPQQVPDLDADLISGLATAKLGWGFSDVVGGWVGEGRGYEAGVVLTLVKDGKALVPKDFVEQADAVWGSHFRDYANAPSTHADEKTQAYCRGYLLEKSTT